jgi:hypothetical protein
MTVENTIIVVMLVAAAALVVAAMSRARRESSGVPESGGPAGAAVEPAPAIGLDELVLVPLPNRRDEALVIGSEVALSVLDDSGLTRRPTTGRPGPLPQLIRSGMAAGGLQATRHAQTGVDSGRLVALSRETMEHLDKGKPVYDKANNMLGIVKDDKGKIRHVMRLDQKGAQAVVASNAATLAVTAALSQQLEQIAEQLAEISETLEGMVRDKDRERLAEVIAANDVLLGVADNVRRRGIADTDAHQLATLKLPVIAKQVEAEFKFEEVLGEPFEKLTRADRVDKLDRLVEKERLDYWLAVRVQADLARTRADLLNLYWNTKPTPTRRLLSTSRPRRRSASARNASPSSARRFASSRIPKPGRDSIPCGSCRGTDCARSKSRSKPSSGGMAKRLLVPTRIPSASSTARPQRCPSSGPRARPIRCWGTTARFDRCPRQTLDRFSERPLASPQFSLGGPTATSSRSSAAATNTVRSS